MGDLCGRPLVISSSSPCPSMTILTLLSLMKLPYQVLADPHLPHPPTKQRSDTLGKVATASAHSAPTIFFSAHATSTMSTVVATAPMADPFFHDRNRWERSVPLASECRLRRSLTTLSMTFPKRLSSEMARQLLSR